MRDCKILLVVDIEGIIGITNMKDMKNNIEMAYEEISVVISELQRNSLMNITVCNIHDDGTCLDPQIINNFGVELIQGIQNLTAVIDKFSVSLMLGFHCKKNTGWRFDHTFRTDINEMRYGHRDIGEVGAFYRWLMLEGIPVIMVSGEGNFGEELSEFNCLVHTIITKPNESERISDEYLKFNEVLRKAIDIIEDGTYTIYPVQEEKVFIKVDNSDKYVMLQHKYEISIDKQFFVFSSLQFFFMELYNFAMDLNDATQKIYLNNLKLITMIKKKKFSSQEIESLLNGYLQKEIFEINSNDRKNIANKAGIYFEDLLCN